MTNETERVALEEELRVAGSETEAEFLARQAREAKAAMIESAREIVDVRQQIQEHPWIAVGAASVAGLLAGVGLQHRSNSSPETSNGPVAFRKAKKGALAPILSTLVSESVKFIVPTLFTGAVLAKTEEQIDEATENDE